MTTRAIGTQRSARLSIGALLAVLALVASIVGSIATASAAEKAAQIRFPAPLRFHGVLEGIPAAPNAVSPGVFAIDDARREMYASYVDVSEGFGAAAKLVLNRYDLRGSGVPDLIDSRPVEGAGIAFGGNREPYSTAYDADRGIAMFSSTGNTGAFVDRFDVRSAKTLPSFNVTQSLPGFSAVGMTYSAHDDRLYLLGELSGTSAVGIISDALIGAYRGAPVVVALDAETGEREWVRAIPQCQQPLVTFGVGGLVARSELRDALYFFCQPGGSAAFAGPAAGSRNPGQSALIRLGISPDAGQPEAAAFGVEVFPVSGSYKDGGNTGIGAFDPATDRVIVQSRATRTPGAWVFDGRLDAWVGFITAPSSNNSFLGVNPRTGRHYMGGQLAAGAPPSEAYLNIADARLSPVPQGQTIALADGTGIGYGPALIALDPATQRLFPGRVGPDAQIAVIEDMTPVQTVDDSIDFDALTSDEKITDATLVQYSGGAAGFGANVRLAGGAGAGTSGAPGFAGETLRSLGLAGMPPCASVPVEQVADDVSCVSSGDREVTLGSVPTVDVRNSGASAQAIALKFDDNTEAERDGTRRTVRDRTDGKDDGPSRVLQPAFGRVDCLDGGADKQDRETPEHPLGAARVVCDLAHNAVTATSEFGDIAGQPLGISSSSFDTSSSRRGNSTVTDSVAAARGVRIGAEDGPHVTFGAVRTITRTVAGGRPGTTLARWERTLTGVSVYDQAGKEILSAPGCSTTITAQGGHKTTTTDIGECKTIVAAANDALDGRAELRLPMPQMDATPKGAFAAINKTQRDFLQASTMQNEDRKAIPGLEAIVFNDGEEKSRLIVQMAAVESNAIFLISNFGSFPWGNGNEGNGEVDGDGDGAGSGGAGSAGGDRGGAKANDGAGGKGAGFTSGGAGTPGVGDAGLSDTGLIGDPLTASPMDTPLAEVASGGVASQIAAGLRWLARTPGEAALIGAMWLLFSGALMVAVRRGVLIHSLSNVTETSR